MSNAYPTIERSWTDRDDTTQYSSSDGMSMREFYAAKALQGFCANPAVFAENGRTGWGLVNATKEDLANYCMQLADAMILASETE